jgi:hypothetical protein
VGVLNRTPDGFLDLSGQRVGGRYPTQLSDVVAPTVDLTTLLTGRLVASETAQILTSNVGDTATIEVPENETWLLFCVSLLYTAGPSQRLTLRAYLQNLPGSSDPANTVDVGVFIGSAGIDASRFQSGTTHFNPIALSPGTLIVGQVQDENATNIPWQIDAGVVKLVGN